MCIVKPDGSPQLCKTDEIGEIVINSRAGGTMYYGLPGVTKNTFEVCQCVMFKTQLHANHNTEIKFFLKVLNRTCSPDQHVPCLLSSVC